MKSIKSRKKPGRSRRSIDTVSTKDRSQLIKNWEKMIQIHMNNRHVKLMGHEEPPEITRSYITPLKNKIKELSDSASQWMNWIKRLIWS